MDGRFGKYGGAKQSFARAAAFAAEVAAETLWPTRCAICDVPGSVLCERCIRDLPYLDWWRACKRCGAPYGVVQCDRCNDVVLAGMGRERLPYAACASAVEFAGTTGCIVRVFKDQGEQRLADSLARMMANALPPTWPVDAVTFVPATLSAYRYRGYDHAALLGEAVAGLVGRSCIEALDRPKTRDQRLLTGMQRVRNLAGSFHAREGAVLGMRVLIVDDVYTTGATLCAATDALLAAGVREVRCLTFARV